MQLSAKRTQEIAARLVASNRTYLHAGRISSHGVGKLVGELIFSQTCLFGKFARSHLRCLYRKLYREFYTPKISNYEGFILRWRADVVANLPPPHPAFQGAIAHIMTSPFTRTQIHLQLESQISSLMGIRAHL